VKRRGAVALVVLVAWAAGLAIFVRRELENAPAQRLAEAALRVSPGAVYYRVEKDGAHIGFASSTIDTTRGGLLISDYLSADLPVAGREHRATATSDVRLSRGLSLAEFKLSFESDGAPIAISGAAVGDSSLRVIVSHDESAADTQHVALSAPIILPTIVPIAIALGESPKVGKSYTLQSFDPVAMAPTPLVVRVEAESSFTVPDSARFDDARRRWTVARRDSVHAWRISTDGPSAVRAWIDEQGRVVELEHALGFSLRRTAYEIAFENWRLEGGTRARTVAGDRDILETTAIAASVPLERRRPSKLRVRLRGADLRGFALDGGRQALSGDTLVIERETDAPGAAPYTMPMPLAMRMSFRREISAEPLVQSGDPQIIALARRIRGETRDPVIVARRINRWVHDSLKKTIAVTIPSATQVLASRSGDCNEHTQLFLALSRAAGIPARAAAGLAHVGGKFYYHAWPEVFVGKWVAVDPTFGQFPADAAHLRFVYGGLARQAELLKLMGTLKIDVLSSE
jgi:transglutaminase-like putative cysteine protease